MERHPEDLFEDLDENEPTPPWARVMVAGAVGVWALIAWALLEWLS